MFRLFYNRNYTHSGLFQFIWNYFQDALISTAENLFLFTIYIYSFECPQTNGFDICQMPACPWLCRKHLHCPLLYIFVQNLLDVQRNVCIDKSLQGSGNEECFFMVTDQNKSNFNAVKDFHMPVDNNFGFQRSRG